VPRRSKPDLTGQVVVVTGANAGIGKETAVALAAMGATVVMTARARTKGEEAAAEARRRSGSEAVELGDLDLSSFASIRAFAAWFLDRHPRLDVLVANAGLILDTRRETAEGFEEMFGVNHLGHFLLTDLLRERLVASAPARVVVVSSALHRLAVTGLNRADLQSTRSFEGFTAYAHSKLANVSFALELARRLDGTGVTVNAVHPGIVNSRFGADGDTGALGAIISVLGRFVLRSARSGARTSVLLASSDEPRVASVTGGYFSHGRRWPPSAKARSVEEARWLWSESERVVAAASASSW
jgi:NAD(P)-dependent dehydrogenase (short-subunit alcohol dehydrogenase family)